MSNVDCMEIYKWSLKKKKYKIKNKKQKSDLLGKKMKEEKKHIDDNN